MLKNYYTMSEELEQLQLMFGQVSLSSSSESQKVDLYLQTALEAEHDLKQFKIK